MYEARGKIKVIFETQTFASGFSKREFVITTVEDRYPQDIKFTLLKEKGDFLNDLSEGQDVAVNFDVRGNEYNGKYYVDLNAWKITPGDGSAAPAPQRSAQPQQQSPAPAGQAAPPQQQAASTPSPFEDDEDIPF